MTSGWRETTFGECAELVRDGVSPAECGDAPYIGLEHIGEDSLQLLDVGQANTVSSVKSRFRSGDVLFGKLRPYFRKVVRPRFDGICSTDIWVVRPAEGVDAGYLFYVMASQDFVDTATQGSEGTRMPRAKWEYVSRIRLPLPPLHEQRAIARVLGTLDDKIELNRRMNATLEAMARALFRSWFVDFEPVRAKQEGRWRAGQSLPGLPAHLHPHVPARLVPTPHGPTPAGWPVSTAGEAVSVRGGSTPSTKEPAYWGGEHCFATPKDLSQLQEPILASTARQLTDAGVARIRSGLLPVGTLLLSSRAPIGYLAVTEVPTVINQGIIAMVCEGPVGAAYALNWTRENMDAIEARASGTTFAEISKSAFRELPFLVPPEPIHAAYEAAVAPLYEHISANARQSRALAAKRDTLLPRLVSGELTPQIPAGVGVAD